MPTFNVNLETLRAVPDGNSDLKWFGFTQEKEQISRAIRNSMRQKRPYGAILQGAWGSGKTHSAKYFSALRIGDLADESTIYDDFLSIYLEGPKAGSPSFQDFFYRAFNAIGFRQLTAAVAQIEASGQMESFAETLYQETNDEDVATIFGRMIGSSPGKIRGVFLGKSTKKERDELEIIRDFKTEFEMSLLLRGMFLALSWPNTAESRPKRVLLWIDELENLIFMREAQVQQFSQHFRQFWDSAVNVTVMLCFSFSDPNESATIDNVLTSALVERISERIILNYPDTAGVNSYVSDLLRSISDPAQLRTASHYPLTDEGFARFINLCEGRTPRTINLSLLRIIEDAEASRGRGDVQGLIGVDVVTDSFGTHIETIGI
jgi:hypothetical protein